MTGIFDVRSFPDVNSTRVRVSTNGGIEPLWAKSGRELFFMDEDRGLRTARFDPASGQHQAPELLFSIPVGYLGGLPGQDFYDVSSDGERFLMVRPFGGDSQGDLILVQNFFEELKPPVPN